MRFKGCAILLIKVQVLYCISPVFSEVLPKVVLICLSAHKFKFELFGGGLCLLLIHFDNLRGTVSEILAKVVEQDDNTIRF